MKAERVTDAVAHHGEGVVWSPQWEEARWVDMLAGDILSLDSEGHVTRRHVATIASALRPRSNGGAVIATATGFLLESPDGTPTHRHDVLSDPQVRMNDGGCDPDGRFYCGSMHNSAKPRSGKLFRLGIDRTVHTVMSDLTISNGLDWTPSGDTAYYTDSATSRIDRFDYHRDTGLTARRPAFAIDARYGLPDGLTIDVDGGIWVALWGGSAVHRYTPSGHLDHVIEVSAKQVSSCTFGGPNLDQLFITTSRQGLGSHEDPAAGSLFRVSPGVTGQPARPFLG